MKAFRRFARKERAAHLVDVPIPVPAENEVLLRLTIVESAVPIFMPG